MNDDFNESNGEPRRRKLDELFADEPWLSPTMKARRLHEKMNGEADLDQVPSMAFVRRTPPIGGAAPGGMVSLAEASAYIRSKGRLGRVTEAQGEKLERLRDMVLKEWVKVIPDAA